MNNIDEYLNREQMLDSDVTILSPGIVECKNILHNPKEIVEKIEQLDKNIVDNKKTLLKSWQKWIYDYNNDNKVSLCLFKPVPEVAHIAKYDPLYDEQMYISELLYNAVDAGLKKYYNIYPRAEKNIRSKEKFPKLLKYYPGSFMPAHSDHGITSRTISCILYLNDDYVGGELYFPYFDITFKPSAGSVVFFPSNFMYVHEVKEIKDGVRYSFPNWFHNLEKPLLPENPNSKTEMWNSVENRK
jgi:prolyl 4-hydroxylase